MTAVTLKITGSQKENVAAIMLSNNANSYRWGANGQAPLNGTLDVVAATYNVTGFANADPVPHPLGNAPIPNEPALEIEVEADW